MARLTCIAYGSFIGERPDWPIADEAIVARWHTTFTPDECVKQRAESYLARHCRIDDGVMVEVERRNRQNINPDRWLNGLIADLPIMVIPARHTRDRRCSFVIADKSLVHAGKPDSPVTLVPNLAINEDARERVLLAMHILGFNPIEPTRLSITHAV